MKAQAFFVTLLTVYCLFSTAKQALAVEIPDFPSCYNPQGVIKVSYSDGIHGIAGDSTEHIGRDTVYQLDNNNLQQCFCPANGQGIQTNWWKISSLDEGQRDPLINSGWIYIPNGALWGLEETSYLVKNSNYDCTSNSDSSGGTGGAVLNASASIGEVLGLASTGGNFWPFVLAVTGAAALALGIILNLKSSRK